MTNDCEKKMSVVQTDYISIRSILGWVDMIFIFFKAFEAKEKILCCGGASFPSFLCGGY